MSVGLWLLQRSVTHEGDRNLFTGPRLAFHRRSYQELGVFTVEQDVPGTEMSLMEDQVFSSSDRGLLDLVFLQNVSSEVGSSRADEQFMDSLVWNFGARRARGRAQVVAEQLLHGLP